MPLEKVRKVMKIAKGPSSLETPIGDEEDSHLGDFIEDKNAIIPVDAAIQANLKETVTRVLASLTTRAERVLRMRFGIGMNTDHTRSEEHTPELQSLMRTSYAVFCLKKKYNSARSDHCENAQAVLTRTQT